MENNDTKILDVDIIAQITGYMRVGAEYLLASAAAGIPKRTAMVWFEKSEAAAENDSEDIYYKLHETIRQATAHAEVIALQRLSAEGGAAGARWLLEKMSPAKYGKAKKESVEFEQNGMEIMSSDDLASKMGL